MSSDESHERYQPVPEGKSTVRLDVFRSLLEPMRPGRLLDVATGHGKFALIAHELGWQVTAMDARTERMPMTAGIEWVESDLRTFPIEGFDVVTLLGILYHLGVEDQLSLLRRCAGTTTIIDTHVARRPELSEGGYEGRAFPETNPDAPTAAWGNDVAFWPTESELVRMITDCGFRFVFALTPPVSRGRTWYLCR